MGFLDNLKSNKKREIKADLYKSLGEEIKQELKEEVKQELYSDSTNSNVSLKDIKSVYHFKNSNEEISDLIYGVIQKIVNTVSMADLELFIDNKKTVNDLTLLLKTRINPYQTFTEFMFFMETQRNLKGNAFAYILRGTSDSEILGVYPLFSDDISTFESPTDKSLWYQINGIDKPIHPTDMIHVRTLGINAVTTNHKGLSPVTLLNKVKTLDYEVIDSTITKLQSPLADLLITDEVQDDETKELVIEMLVNYYSNKGGPLYNDFGIDIQQLESKFTITDLEKSDGMVKSRIASVFQTPIQLIGGAYDYNGISETYLYWLTSTISPILKQYSDQFSCKLLPLSKLYAGAYFSFNKRSLLQSDFKTMQSYYTAAIRSGWMSIDEVRIEQGFDPFGNNASGLLISGDLYPLDLPVSERNGKKTEQKEDLNKEDLTKEELKE